jgi:hypothetical protein
MRDIKIVDPRNEMVLYYFAGKWEVVGPLRSYRASEAVQWCIDKKVPAFICLREEFEKFGTPVDIKACEYYNEPPDWWLEVECQRGDDEEEYKAPTAMDSGEYFLECDFQTCSSR